MIGKATRNLGMIVAAAGVLACKDFPTQDLTAPCDSACPEAPVPEEPAKNWNIDLNLAFDPETVVNMSGKEIAPYNVKITGRPPEYADSMQVLFNSVWGGTYRPRKFFENAVPHSYHVEGDNTIIVTLFAGECGENGSGCVQDADTAFYQAASK